MTNLNKRDEILELFDEFGPLLTQVQRQALHLRYIEDLSLGEIAEITATTRSAINDAIRKGEKKLYSIFKKMNK